MKRTTVNSKLPNTGTSIFAVMSGLANEVGAINLSQGFPDFSPSRNLQQLVTDAMRDGHNQYAPMPGVPALRQAISNKIKRLYNVEVDPDDEITITAGATQALFNALTALVRPGDEVVIIEPAYDSYGPAVILNGGTPVYVKLKAPRFEVDWEELESNVNSKTRVIMMNTPHNPTGAVWSADDMKRLEKLAIDYDLIVISDEVYEHLVFDGFEHETALKFPELRARSMVTYSFGKVFHNTGWKMGYCVAPAELTAEFRKVHQFLVFSCNTPVQHALAEFLSDPIEYETLPTFFQTKRDALLKALEGSRFSIEPVKGTYFQLLNFENMSDKSDFDFCTDLARNHGVAAIPISSFYHDKHDDKFIRLCFAKSTTMLEEAGKRLCKI